MSCGGLKYCCRGGLKYCCGGGLKYCCGGLKYCCRGWCFVSVDGYAVYGGGGPLFILAIYYRGLEAARSFVVFFNFNLELKETGGLYLTSRIDIGRG